MTKVLSRSLLGVGLLLVGKMAFAYGPCPDGNFNPQQQVCMCPGGGYVAPGNWCGKPKLADAWGAIAIDRSSGQKAAGWGYSKNGQKDANKDALDACGLASCQVVVTVKNSCAAVVADGKGIWGGGVDIDRAKALEKAAAACYSKGAERCFKWVEPLCANAPRQNFVVPSTKSMKLTRYPQGFF